VTPPVIQACFARRGFHLINDLAAAPTAEAMRRRRQEFDVYAARVNRGFGRRA
jgi:hypothetical protein